MPAFPFFDIAKLEISSGIKMKTGRGALTEAIIGGLVIGVTAGTSSGGSCAEDEWLCSEEMFNSGEKFLAGAAIGALAGGTIGAIVGSFYKVERWKEIPIIINQERLSWSVSSQLTTMGITFKWSF